VLIKNDDCIKLMQFMDKVIAEESVIQMTTRPALDTLRNFIADPLPWNASLLTELPALHKLLQHEYAMHKEYSPSIISICKWIHKRGRTILDSLIVYDSPPVQPDVQESEMKWSEVRRCVKSLKMKLMILLTT